jgi:hypothetical protein
MVKYPSSFNHKEYQNYLAWVHEREMLDLEQEAWDQMEKEQKIWPQNQNKPSTHGLKETSTGISSGSSPQPGWVSRTYGRAIKGILCGLKQSPAQKQTSR